jgi:outer membrane protein OmpA-like peptidoglycan-associated protein
VRLRAHTRVGRRSWQRSLGVCSVVLVGRSVAAQPSDFALDRPALGAAGDQFTAVGEPIVASSMHRSSVQLTSNYARGLVEARLPDQETFTHVVKTQWLAHLQAKLVLPQVPRLAWLIDVPLALVNEGEQTSWTRDVYATPRAGLGNVRLGARVGLGVHGKLRTAAELEWGIPTARRHAYLGSRDGHGALKVHGDWEHGPLRAVVSVWGRRDFPGEAILGAEVGSRVGLGLTSERWGTGLEALAWSSPASSLSRSSGHAEVWANVSHRVSGWTVRLAGGPGFGLGPGTPVYRVLLGVGYQWGTPSVTTLPPATLSVGHSADPAVERPRWTPSAASERLRSQVVAAAEPALRPAPAQATQAAAAEGDCSAGEGCHRLGMSVGEHVTLPHPILFGLGRDVLPLDVEERLGSVVEVLNGHPELVRVAIEGHTDDIGDERANLALSRRRAVAVMRWLIERGVDERRLQVRAFGSRYPRFDNTTEEGRANNRRVEFTIVERDERGKDAWHTGPAIETVPPAAPPRSEGAEP